MFYIDKFNLQAILELRSVCAVVFNTLFYHIIQYSFIYLFVVYKDQLILKNSFNSQAIFSQCDR